MGGLGNYIKKDQYAIIDEDGKKLETYRTMAAARYGLIYYNKLKLPTELKIIPIINPIK